ncbi:response regulator [Aromatoleum toluvorans]|uniref:Response regulator n=2 Tax=Aromatoleum toluvorans TaxID=92002 RepID=A0ABX1Q4X5_9RHOO|nr:response regulator [Aromatoleum toluvorans]
MEAASRCCGQYIPRAGMSNTILIIEDDETLRLTLLGLLSRKGYEVQAAACGLDGLALARETRFGLILLDLRLPDIPGLEVIARLHEFEEDALVVTMTAYPEVRTAVAALKAGAYDYINKPFDLDDLDSLIRRAFETRQLRREVEWRRAQAGGDVVPGLIGDSAAFRELLETTRKIAAAGRVPALILGESGTGKEHIAQSIHSLSARAAGPWVTLNCSALPEGLLESEMFGHEKGAFTDARQAKKGLLELADGGTLFLDEVGDLSPALQPKLLRVLETQTFRRLGGSKEIRVDVRFVAATHRNLPAMVRDGGFREDLFYRLNVGSIAVPPLRERAADILPLARHFLEQAALHLGMASPAIQSEVMSRLLAYRWPGNIRELRNVMERAAILASDGVITVEQLPFGHAPAPARGESAATAGEGAATMSLAAVERQHILRVLEHAAGNKTRAAEILGITRLTLRTKLREYELRPGAGEGDEDGFQPVKN